MLGVRPPLGPDITGLNSLTEQATQLLGSATVSSDGSDVPTDQYWVPQSYNIELGDVISEALALSRQGESADYQAVEDAKKQLQDAMDRFTSARKLGTNTNALVLEVKDLQTPITRKFSN